jgi:methylenetetrahydrofolate dehydrogenase (NADP+)/methenyltetrahydrofolate cyclohydrolase
MELTHIKLIPGKELAMYKQAWLKQRILELKVAPVLKIIQVGTDPASTLYTSLKAKSAEKLGISAEVIRFPSETPLETIRQRIEDLNNDSLVDGIMVQSPIPGLPLAQSLQVFNNISANKDVDGLTHASLGRLWQLKNLSDLAFQHDLFVSATPLSVLDSLSWFAMMQPGYRFGHTEQNIPQEHVYEQFINIPRKSKLEALQKFLTGQKVLIINRSNIVGKPLAALMQMGNATVTMAHSQSRELSRLIAESDIVLAATGKDHLFSALEFRPGQLVVDIGINNNNPEQAVKGDVKFQDLGLEVDIYGGGSGGVEDSNGDRALENLYLSAVPGGVGPLTVVNLLCNTYLSYIRKNSIQVEMI